MDAPHESVYSEIPDGICLYGRLSRADERDRETPIADKIARRKEDLLYLATRHYHLPVTPEAIVFDAGISGKFLTERPLFLAVIEKCSRREIHTLVVMEIERITRSLADWTAIEKALFRGRVRLITGQGEYVFDANLDPFYLQILVSKGASELYRYSWRVRRDYEQRVRQGEYVKGRLPYGYLWDRTNKRWLPDPVTYPRLSEICERAFFESLNALAADLNRRRIPTPGQVKGYRADPRSCWWVSTVRAILANPHNCGFRVKRREKDREGQVRLLPESEWIWSAAGSYPCPLTHERWALLQEKVRGQRQNRGGQAALLSGLLFASCGRGMSANGRAYSCKCPETGLSHPGNSISRRVLESAVLRLLDARLAALPQNTFRRPTRTPDLDALRAALALARSRFKEKQESYTEMQQNAALYKRLPHFDYPRQYEEGLLALGQQVDALSREVERLEEKLLSPALRIGLPVLRELQSAGGFQRLFASEFLSLAEKRSLLRDFIRRLDLPDKESVGTWHRNIRITLYPPFGSGEPERLPLSGGPSRHAPESVCPLCGVTARQEKRGKSKGGKQRYACKACGKSYGEGRGREGK